MKSIIILAAVLATVLGVTVGPILTIAAINTLFGLGIGITFWTWLSVLWIHVILVNGAFRVGKG